MKQQKEIWKDINDIGSLYQISSFGRVRKVIGKDNKGKLYYKELKTFETASGNGVVKVCLRDIDFHGHYGNYTVATLVAETFLKDKKPKGAIGAKTIKGNKPTIDNIEWVVPKSAPKKGSRFVFIMDGKEVGIYNSLRDVAVMNKYSYDLLRKIITKQTRVKGVQVKRI